MSQESSGFTPNKQGPQLSSEDPGYVPNEEERRVITECQTESFFFRSLPLSLIAIGVTNVLLYKGILSPSPPFGPFPKIAMAGLFGFNLGLISYMKTCEEKFLKLTNSPIAESIRQRRVQPIPVQVHEPGFDPNPSESQQSGLESAFQPMTEVTSMPESYRNYTSDYTYSRPSQSYDPTPFSSGFSDSGPINLRNDIPSQAPLYADEDVPVKKPVLYEELRNKNRENYEIILTQEIGVLIKPQTEGTLKKKVKKNKYGDFWEQ